MFKNNEVIGSGKTGKLVGGMAAMFGVFLLSLPIPILVNNFASCYKNRLWNNYLAMRKAEMVELEKQIKEMKENLKETLKEQQRMDKLALTELNNKN